MNLGDPVVAICALIGSLIGTVSFLFRQLVTTKNRRINELLDERDYWRKIVTSFVKLPDGTPMPDYDTYYNEQHRPAQAGRETFLSDQSKER